ncbi:Domain of unknown function DUF4373 [uncultured Caudovirales phage]|uniref:Lin1244/Lin1753-like N-terminal domain-containing protein n=1 Tax=uncultured Caudovirales phage TaxID=2100421 RepID=A0A6J5ST91_9CAUD|nr:Domain of unknown function DUF4373 [uncultured Caudovirales phage]
MTKDTYYFSHDYNSRTDSKIKRLIAKHGFTGYGLFWAIVEDLYNNANALPTDYECIAYDLRTDLEIVKSVINDFDLFVFDETSFGSLSVEKRINERNEKSKKAKESAEARWAKHANALRTQSDGNAIKKRKGKETKENKEYQRPLFFLKENEIEFEQIQMKSRLNDFDECLEQWSLSIEGSDFKYSEDQHEDYRKLKARFEKWVNSWRTNKAEKDKPKPEKLPESVRLGKAKLVEVNGQMLVKPLNWTP